MYSNTSITSWDTTKHCTKNKYLIVHHIKHMENKSEIPNKVFQNYHNKGSKHQIKHKLSLVKDFSNHLK